MTDANSSATQTAHSNVAARIGWAILIVATLYVCYFSHLGALGFVGPDEPRYAWIARAMTETGDWVTPRLYGEPWFEKPPLFYWGAAICFKLFGVSEAAARLPSAICALLATLAMAWLAWRMYGGETARWLLLLLPTTVGMIGFSHAAATDMPFSGMLTVAMVCAAVVLRLTPHGASDYASLIAHNDTASSAIPPSSSRAATQTSVPSAAPGPATSTPWLALLLFGFFLGLAVLAKGPAGIVLCGGAVFFWAVFTKRWRDAFRLFHPAAIAAFCVTALPWYILCARRNPDFFRVFIIEHNFKRYLTPEFQHIQPFWFYVPVVLAALLPWAFLFLWKAISGAIKLYRTRQISQFDSFLVYWPAFTILFFTLSKSKLPGYVLPALPPLAILTAREVTARVKNPAIARAWLSLGGLTLILLGVLGYKLNDSIPFVTDIRPAPAVEQFAAIACLGGLVVISLALSRRCVASGLGLVLTMLSFLTLDTGDLWELDDGVSARPMVMTALEQLTTTQAAAATVFKLRRAYKYQIDFYLRRETQEWGPDAKQDSIVFTDYKDSAELVRLGGWCPHYIAFPAVWVCEGTKEPTILMHSSGAAGSRQPQ